MNTPKVFQPKVSRFFSKEELQCPCCGKYNFDGAFLMKLDRLRELCGEPLYVNSACRCEKHNKDIGGSPESSHLKGLAIDIRCEDNQLRYKIIAYWTRLCLTYMLPCRIEIGGEKYIHIDIDRSKFRDIIWFNKKYLK